MHRLLHPMPGLHWSEIRATAVECAAHGWPVQPGSYRLDEDGPWLGAGADDLVPVPRWQHARITSEVAEELWTSRPYTVLLDLRRGVSAVPVPAARARAVARGLGAAGVPAPVVVTGGVAHVLVAAVGAAPVRGLRPWVALPPGTPCGQCSRWLTHPLECDWALPELTAVLPALSADSDTEEDPCQAQSA